MQGTQMVGRAYQIGFLFFFFVVLRDLRGCNEALAQQMDFSRSRKVSFAV